jgi:hypothetical protein
LGISPALNKSQFCVQELQVNLVLKLANLNNKVNNEKHIFFLPLGPEVLVVGVICQEANNFNYKIIVARLFIEIHLRRLVKTQIFVIPYHLSLV